MIIGLTDFSFLVRYHQITLEIKAVAGAPSQVHRALCVESTHYYLYFV